MASFEGLGKALRWLRARQDRKQYQVADAAGVTKAMLSAYETGKQKPSLETLEKILAGLDASLEDLHEALRFVRNQEGDSQRVPEPRVSRGGGDGMRFFEPDPYGLLGIGEPMPVEEEQAMRQMLGGFHRLLRHYHTQQAAYLRQLRQRFPEDGGSDEDGD